MTTFSWTFALSEKKSSNGMVFAKTVQRITLDFYPKASYEKNKKDGQEIKLSEMGEIEKQCFNQGKRPWERG